MRDTEVNGLSIYKSLENSIAERIEKLRNRLEKNNERLKGRLGIIEKLSLNNTNKSYEEEIRGLTELSKLVMELHYNEKDKYKLPQGIISNLNDISALLTDEETEDLRNVVNNNLKNTNREKKDKIKRNSIEVQRLLSKLGLSDKALLVYDELEYKKNVSYETSIKIMERELLDNLTPEYVSVKNIEKEQLLPNNEKMMISKLEEMINKKQINTSKNVNMIIENISNIKLAMEVREKSNNLLLLISNTLNELNNINEIDVTMIKTYFNKLAIKYRKELEKANKFLEKFDFNEIKKQIEVKKEEDEKNKLRIII